MLADFIVDFSAKEMYEAEKEATQAFLRTQDLWVLHTASASNACGFGMGLMLEVPTGKIIRQSIRCPDMANNEVEYEAVIAELRLVLRYGAKQLKLYYDSQLVVNQVTGTFQIKDQRLQKYQTEICRLLPNFEECQLDQISRTQNVEADGVAKLAVPLKE